MHVSGMYTEAQRAALEIIFNFLFIFFSSVNGAPKSSMNVLLQSLQEIGLCKNSRHNRLNAKKLIIHSMRPRRGRNAVCSVAAHDREGDGIYQAVRGTPPLDVSEHIQRLKIAEAINVRMVTAI